MKGVGIGAAVAGVLLGLLALIMQTDVGGTINIGLLQNQHLTFLGGCFLFLAGVVIACTGIAIEAVRGAPAAIAVAGVTPADGATAAVTAPTSVEPDAAPAKGPKEVDDIMTFGAILACIIVLAFAVIFLSNH